MIEIRRKRYIHFLVAHQKQRRDTQSGEILFNLLYECVAQGSCSMYSFLFLRTVHERLQNIIG